MKSNAEKKTKKKPHTIESQGDTVEQKVHRGAGCLTCVDFVQKQAEVIDRWCLCVSQSSLLKT